MQFNNVFVVEDVASLGVLAVVDAGAPDFLRILAFLANCYDGIKLNLHIILDAYDRVRPSD